MHCEEVAVFLDHCSVLAGLQLNMLQKMNWIWEGAEVPTILIRLYFWDHVW